jgi:hypothetical protein
MGVKLGIDSADDGYLFHCPGCGNCHKFTTVGLVTWGFNGNMEKPTFTPSILVTQYPKGEKKVCHSWITNGFIQFLPDSTHKLKGQTVELEDWD